MNNFFLACIIILAVLILLCLVRAIRGPKIADRIMASNMIGTLTVAVILLLAVDINESFIIDVCLVYAVISFLAVIIITKIYIGLYRQHKHDIEAAGEASHRSEPQEAGAGKKAEGSQPTVPAAPAAKGKKTSGAASSAGTRRSGTAPSAGARKSGTASSAGARTSGTASSAGARKSGTASSARTRASGATGEEAGT